VRSRPRSPHEPTNCDRSHVFVTASSTFKQRFGGSLVAGHQASRDIALLRSPARAGHLTLQAGCPGPGDSARCDRSQQHNAQIGTIHEVAYTLHPWHGQRVVVVREIKKQGQSFVHCRLDDGELILAIPLWMFDNSLCSSFRELDTPEVDWKSLQQLRSAALSRFLHEVGPRWRRWLNRRNNLRSMTWEKFSAILRRYPLAPARAVRSTLRRAANP
jgi:hypothetical protein